MPTKIVKQIVDGESLAASFVSQSVPIGPYVDNIAFNIELIGVSANVGVFTVEHRIVKDHGRRSAWGKLRLSEKPVIDNEDDVFILYLNQAPIGELRVVFTTDSGDGTCDIWYSGRDV